MMRPRIIVSTPESEYFANRLSKQLGMPQVDIFRNEFAGHEKYRRIQIGERLGLVGVDVVFVASTHTDEAIDEVCYLGEQIAQNGAHRVIYINPFFGYQTMEREVLANEVVMGKRVAVRMSHILAGDVRNSFLLLDTHIPTLADMFEGPCLRKHLYAEPFLAAAAQQLINRGMGKFKIGSADLSRLKWNKSYARLLGADGVVAVDKDRDFETSQVTAVMGEVSGFAIIIYDDMTRSADSLIHAAESYFDNGAVEVHAVLSHFALDNRKVVEKILDSPIRRFIFTNSHPMSQIPEINDYPDRFTCVDVSGVYVDPIQQILN